LVVGVVVTGGRVVVEVETVVPATAMVLVETDSGTVVEAVGSTVPGVVEPGTVVAISGAPLAATDTEVSRPAYKVTVSLAPLAIQTLGLNHPPQAGTRVEAEIPLGRKPLILWFFSRPAS